MTGGMGRPLGREATLIAAAIALGLAGSSARAAAPCEGVQPLWFAVANTLELSGGGACSLSALKQRVPEAPLHLVDGLPGTWWQGCNLLLSNGATLELHGRAAGGDVDELRLRSENEPGGAVALMADWGTLDLESTRVVSWDRAADGPDQEVEAFGRAYVLARSTLGADGTPHESRLDIRGSELAFLGADAPEAYGVTWKVNVADAADLPRVHVRGGAQDSRLHHNFRGLYAFGGQDLAWVDNDVAGNLHAGLDLHDDSDRMVVHGNRVSGNGSHGIIASGRSDHVRISGNTCTGNGGHGIILHQASDDAEVLGNQASGNALAGLAVFDSRRGVLTGNTSAENQFGLQVSVGASDNAVEGNEFRSNRSYGIYLLPGDAAPSQGDERPKGNRFVNNRLHGNADTPVRLKDADANLFLANRLGPGNGEGFLLSNAVDNDFQDNTCEGDLWFTAGGTPQWPANSTVRGQPSLQVQLTGTARLTLVEPSGRIYRSDDSLPVEVSADGAALTLTASNTGSKVHVDLMDLWVSPPAGKTVTVRPVKDREALVAFDGWTGGGSAKVDFEVGGAARPGGYSVRKSGRITRPLLLPDGHGRVRFTESLNADTAELRLFPFGAGCAAAPPGPVEITALLALLAWSKRLVGRGRQHRR